MITARGILSNYLYESGRDKARGEWVRPEIKTNCNDWNFGGLRISMSMAAKNAQRVGGQKPVPSAHWLAAKS